jgi:hypothetical protein
MAGAVNQVRRRKLPSVNMIHAGLWVRGGTYWLGRSWMQESIACLFRNAPRESLQVNSA